MELYISYRRVCEEVRRGWPMGLLAKGVMVADIYAGGRLDVLEKFYARYLTSEGRFRFSLKYVDDALHGEVLLYLYKKTGNQKYRQASDEIFYWLLGQYRRSKTTLPYRDKISVRFVDTLGMIIPFLFEYNAQFVNKDAQELAVLHMEDFILFAVEKRSGLPFHGYNVEFSNMPTGLFSWGRGVGWYVLGLVEVLTQLTSSNTKFEFFQQSFIKLANTVRDLQKKDGGWGDIINISTSKYDSSATAMILYAFKKAMMAGIIDPSYQDMLSQGFHRLQGSTTKAGVVLDSQGVCMGLNKHSGVFSFTPYSQGMVLAATSVMIFELD